MADENHNPVLEELSSGPLRIIRTETVLSRLPAHSLSKKGSFEISIVRRNAAGEVELRWEVSHSAKYGPPRQLAYKIDTVIINRRIDEQGRPVPRILRIGSLREIARELGLGGDTNSIRKALRQNAFTGITAKLSYRGVDGSEKHLEADFTRYAVVLAGETLPDGAVADSVYVVFNEPYLEVLNNAPTRPLDYDYLKELPPSAQRFYEIVSYKIFSALKAQRPEARLLYSEFCTFSAQQRYSDYDHFKKQMYKIHRPHLSSGYIRSVRYEAIQDERGAPDWVMFYTPGPKAIAEFETFTTRRLTKSPTAALPQPQFDPELAQELEKRGVSEKLAREIASRKEQRDRILEQIRWGDALIRQARRPIENPAGFYVYLIRENLTPPQSPPESKPAAQGREAPPPAEPAASHAADREAYQAFIEEQVSRYIERELTPEAYAALRKEKQAWLRRHFRSSAQWSAEMLAELSEAAARREVRDRAGLPTFEEFVAQRAGKAPQ